MSPMSQTVQFVRSDLTRSRFVEAALPPLGDGEVRLRIESFSVTANNVTYAVVGDAFGYWNFFPANAEPIGDWGVVPMWAMLWSKNRGIRTLRWASGSMATCRWPVTSTYCLAA